jgi:hypothetical protein
MLIIVAAAFIGPSIYLSRQEKNHDTQISMTLFISFHNSFNCYENYQYVQHTI